LKNTDYGGFVPQADKLLHQKVSLPANYSFHWSGEYELELRAKERLRMILPVVFFVIFLLLYLVFHSVTEALVLILPTIYAMSGGLLLQWFLKYNFSVAVAVAYIALCLASQSRPAWSWSCTSMRRSPTNCGVEQA
jgi:Cu(I)/Ag(I) efflux system membrane protein CusA/SilA